MSVYAIGTDAMGGMSIARNGNETECKNIPGKCGCTHAEDLLLRSMPNPIIVYVTHSPCIDCAKKLVEAEVKVVRYMKEYRKTDGIDYLRGAGIEVKQLEG